MRKNLLFTFFIAIGCGLYAWIQQPCAIGQKAPNFAAQTIYGDTLSLEKYRGNIVLLDFWASWNTASRRHNLTTRKTYEKYRAISLRKKRKFIIIQVSLDTRPDLHTTAISKDNLYWKTHVCDYKGWHSDYTTLFNINRLPTNFLIDTAGIIVAKDVWDANLDEQLQTLMQ